METSPLFSCTVCGETFASKTKLFKHLPAHGVVRKEDKPVRIILLVGWKCKEESLDKDVILKNEDSCDLWLAEQSISSSHYHDSLSLDMENHLFKALYSVENGLNIEDLGSVTDAMIAERKKMSFSRGTGISQRTSPLFSHEENCQSLTDTFCLNVKPFGVGEKAIESFLLKLNSFLPPYIRAHNCYFLGGLNSNDFHAEMSCTQRRYEYLVPLKSILPPLTEELKQNLTELIKTERPKKKSRLEHVTNKIIMDEVFPIDTIEGKHRVEFFRKLKGIFKTLAGKKKFHNFVTAGTSPIDGAVSRRIDRVYHKEIIKLGEDNEEFVVFSISGDSLLRGQVRKLLGASIAVASGYLPLEFLEVSLADDSIVEVPGLPTFPLYLAECRYACYEANGVENRLDPRRIDGSNTDHLDLWADDIRNIIYTKYQVFGNKWYESFIKQCQVYGERFHKIQSYRNRTQQFLIDSFKEKFGEKALDSIIEREKYILQLQLEEKERLEQEKLEKDRLDKEKKEQEKREREALGLTSNSRNSKQRIPNKDIKNDSNNDKDENNVNNENSAPPSPPKSDQKHNDESENSLQNSKSKRTGKDSKYQDYASSLKFVEVEEGKDDTPAIYAKVLKLLREADQSGLWPSSSTGRQSVISSDTLIELGGRGGSFSVGALPRHLIQPKGNEIFPELMRECFKLEKALFPNRPVSATIAINRHAQFNPHRDSGAGAGQTTSLIVSLGAFTGGELVSANKPYDIRYNPIEFNGWDELHYTLPFVGERYSLVWFTPLGLTEEDMWWWKEDEMKKFYDQIESSKI